MPADTSDSHCRQSTRLRGYDYSQAGAYFVTICTRDRLLLFEDDSIREIAERCWLKIPDRNPQIELDRWVIMPNHLHGIIAIRRGVQVNAPTEAPTRDPSNRFSRMSPRRNTIGVIVRTYKAAVTTMCRRSGHTAFAWQRNYYEHVIRNDEELDRVRQYIDHNSARWDTDRENPARVQAGRRMRTGESEPDAWLYEDVQTGGHR